MQKIVNLNKKTWQWTVLLLLSIMWGSSYILMKKGLQSYSHIQVAAFRIFIAFIFFLPFIIKEIRTLKKKDIPAILEVGFIGNCIPAFLFTKAQTHINSSLAGILNSLVPLFVLIIGAIIYKIKPKKINILGIIVGLAGAIFLIFSKPEISNTVSTNETNNLYGLFIVLACIMYGFNVNVVKNHLAHIKGTTIAALAFLFVGPVAGLSLIFSDFSPVLLSPSYQSDFMFIIILAIIGSGFAVILFNILIQYTTSIFASSVTYIMPIIAIIWGFFDNESISEMQIISIGTILLGVYLINKN